MKLLEALLERDLAQNEHEARGLILAGKVLVNDVPVDKTGHRVSAQDRIRVRGLRHFVSRAGDKLQAALEAFDFPVAGRHFLDVGASTGGFTDALLQAGAASVAAIDVGRGLLHQKLRTDSRVQVLEACDFRKLTPAQLLHTPEAFVADVSFTSLLTMMEHAFALLHEKNRPREGIVLFKPQFELPRGEREKLNRGILTDESRALRLLDEFGRVLEPQGIAVVARLASPVKGAKGNQEYLLHLQAINRSLLND
jgi:23S rRNA (cytidine1920-2'-O)/16S rRNA (cytidine1409-2'-O)-methyltransferase